MNEIEKFKNKLQELDACEEASEWAQGKTLQEVWATCPRGDWMLWLFRRTNLNDIRLLIKAKALCAETVIHIMKDDRSIKAVRAAIDFGNGKINEQELAAAAAAAAAYAAAAATTAAAAAAAAAAYAAADAAAYAYAADAAAKKKNQLLTANICREILPMPIV